MVEKEHEQDMGVTPEGALWRRDGRKIELFLPPPPEPAAYLVSLPWEPARCGPTKR